MPPLLYALSVIGFGTSCFRFLFQNLFEGLHVLAYLFSATLAYFCVVESLLCPNSGNPGHSIPPLPDESESLLDLICL